MLRSDEIEKWLESAAPTRARPLNPKKRALIEMSANATPQPSRKAKARRIDEGCDKVDVFVDREGSEEEIETPRPPMPMPMRAMPPLPQGTPSATPILSPTQKSRHDADSRSRSQSHSQSEVSVGTGSSVGGKRKRTGSPTKKWSDQLVAQYPVRRQPVQRIPDLPPDLQELVLAMHEIKYMRGILHERHIVWKGDVGPGVPREDDNMFTQTAEEGEKRDQLGTVPDLAWARKRFERAQHCLARVFAEAEWNCFVYSRLLEKALEGTRYNTRANCAYIPSARIHPPDLVPLATRTSLSESKKVDFCITLELNDDPSWDLDELQQSLYSVGVDSLNHTDYAGIRWTPIAVSIETKMPYAGTIEASLQLSTWGAAHIKFLRQMLSKVGNAAVPIIPLPLVVVVGNEWEMYYMQDCGAKKAVMWTSIPIGDTSTLGGIYQVITGIQRLIQWAEQVYRPWFEENIFRPLLGLAKKASVPTLE
ncbi:hypothetical protein AC579_2072 [Pseudocercospora musae]|uniref:PD-(D/E)XK nuclease-like domain-containing protein n=1 Tax=Pseudocercospora musae TaxID=113226 RepID=A0A139GUV7_9PEZI|nr:hypothetical protein AC579_2072 [Pseudocercospora musae]